MSTTVGVIREDIVPYQDTNWFAKYADSLVPRGLQIHLLDTGRYVVGDGVRNLGSLKMLGGIGSIVVPPTPVVEVNSYMPSGW